MYARVDNRQFRLLKAATPGPYTVILEATRIVPRRLSHPSRKTIGLRVPENAVAQALLAELGQPLLGTTLILPDDDGDSSDGFELLNDAERIRTRLDKQIDLIVDGGACSMEATTVIDLTGELPVLVRQGRGDAGVFGL